MTADPIKAKQIFLDAVESVEPDGWSAFLDSTCKDCPEIRGEVEALLAAHSRASVFLENDTPTTAIPEPASRDAIGSLIGQYKLIEQIGEGGMGVVYRAEQQEPAQREVALKIIKPGMDTRNVVARFEVEQQALARMNHPNIAKVFGAGTTESGRPYFVMELVPGIPITRFADQEHMTTRERLDLFCSVCDAVQHAHQKGIIHRDIKPSNVLVSLTDDTPVPKIIDFGIAKAVKREPTVAAVTTGQNQIIGTPLYMSPEQAGLHSSDVDTRTDIYSLGVLLYELLTGTTPIDEGRFREADYDEIRRSIREEEPLRPSNRISSLGMAATTISSHRQVDPQKLSRLLRGELVIANAQRQVGLIYGRFGDREKEEAAYREAISLYEQLGRRSPNNPEYEFRLALVLGSLLENQAALGNTEAARELGERALQTLNRLHDDHSQEPDYGMALAGMHNRLAWELGAVLPASDVEQHHRTALRIFAKR